MIDELNELYGPLSLLLFNSASLIIYNADSFNVFISIIYELGHKYVLIINPHSTLIPSQFTLRTMLFQTVLYSIYPLFCISLYYHSILFLFSYLLTSSVGLIQENRSIIYNVNCILV